MITYSKIMGTGIPLLTLIILHALNINAQVCDDEVSEKGISVTWPRSPPADNVTSDPLCYNNDFLITRNCQNTHWTPPLPKLKPCLQAVKHFDLLACPPSFDRIAEKDDKYCYQINSISSWNGPCFKSGGASVITELGEKDLLALLNSLRAKNISRFFWLPARRAKAFNPVRWYIPGPKWGMQVKKNNSVDLQTTLLKNCLLLDVDKKLIYTETCSKEYPSLCFYMNEMQYPANCPKKYHAVRFSPDDGICYGIEQSDTPLTFDDFRSICSLPMGQNNNNDLSRFIFRNVAELNQLPDNKWCWFSRSNDTIYATHKCHKNVSIENNFQHPEYACSEVAINKVGMLNLYNVSTLTRLSCIACITKMGYGNTEFVFEYNTDEHLIYLTVYSPSGLWRYNNNDSGIQCFSNANGFVSVIDINEVPINDIRSVENDLEIINKKVYTINVFTNRTGQYWCEGHTKKFSLISTEKIVINPRGNKSHVFSLFIKISMSYSDISSLDHLMDDLSQNISLIFSAKRALIMDIHSCFVDSLLVLFHLHIEIADKHDHHTRNIESTYENLKIIAKEGLIKYNYTFVNISSALFCLPTTSTDNLTVLDWEMTSIGHIAAPVQFCLQENGLPVKRLCSGSYLLGSIWGDVEGSCDKNYVASKTTIFLYKFVKSQISEKNIPTFLTTGLRSILAHIELIIPADIYYLSVSLKRILSFSQNNHTSVDLSDIDNMAWVMDRLISLDSRYLNLAQTLNSTNVILDSINEIIETLTYKNKGNHRRLQKDFETIAIQPQCVVQILCPKRNNISGIAIINNKSAYNFTEMTIKPLYRNNTLNEVLLIENLEVAAWLPDNVINSLTTISNNKDNETLDNENVNIVITVFNNDAIFQELDNMHKVNSRLIGISIPGFILNFNHFIPLVFRNLRQSNLESFCGYWDFKAHNRENNLGSWSSRGCFLDKNVGKLTICKCYHLTHFSNLLHIRNYNNGMHIDKLHTKVLNIITLIGSFLSLLGIACIWITACVFQIWRKKAGTKVLLHFSVSIALPLIFMVLFNLDNTIFGEQDGLYAIYDHMKVICIILGALLHYSILASFMWMLITAVLQFIRYVRVLGVNRPSRFMLRLTIIGWGIPIIPVVVLLLVSKENYIPDVSNCSKCAICYPKGIFLILSVVVPVCLILLINIVLFILVLWSVIKGPDEKCRSTDLNLMKAQLRLSIFLFFLLGLTWIFGFLSFSNQLIWSYLFCLTSSLQGFVLFVYFILCDPNTRSLWVTLMKNQYGPRLSRQSISSISSG